MRKGLQPCQQGIVRTALLFTLILTFSIPIIGTDASEETGDTHQHHHQQQKQQQQHAATHNTIPLHSRLFPANDEYDSKILDPATIYGSPYGGFSRATRSRLAALPLRLPDQIIAIMPSEDNNNNDSGNNHLDGDSNHNADTDPTTNEDVPMIHYMETSDGLGRKYVCRVYHEDDLDPVSVTDSMFDAPLLNTGNTNNNKNNADADYLVEDEYIDMEEDEWVEPSPEEEDEPPVVVSPALVLLETERRLSKLAGVCSQIHLGWWSYEWCYDQGVTQFHIHVDSANSGLELQDMTSLGSFTKRKFKIIHGQNKDSIPPTALSNDAEFVVVNKYAEAEPELSRVVDRYDNGEMCQASGKPRQTKVQYLCCSERLMNRYKSPILRNNSPVASKIVSIVSLVEDPNEVCTYSIVVCTPLLCEDVKSADDDGLLFGVAAGSMIKTTSRSSSAQESSSRLLTKKRVAPTPRKENETIRDILDRTMGKACIQSSTSSWWSYEYCHHKHIRQFHETVSINQETGMATTSISADDDEYFLGYYSKELDSYPEEDEWKYVVNTTLSGGGDGSAPSGGGSSSATGGTGGKHTVAAYFTTEFVGGNVCDDADVTDSAIKAGTVRNGHMERSSSVRFACGPSFEIYVNEDHTCHYIVDISVPDLCHHPAFRAPVPKKQVVKCLLVEDADDSSTSSP